MRKIIIALCILVASCVSKENVAPSPTNTTNSEHLVLGNPSNANTDIQNTANYLMLKPEYVMVTFHTLLK